MQGVIKPDQEEHYRLLSAVLTGINRANPYRGDASDDMFNTYANDLFRITHVGSFNCSVQVRPNISPLLTERELIEQPMHAKRTSVPRAPALSLTHSLTHTYSLTLTLTLTQTLSVHFLFVFVQALMLLFQVMDSSQTISDRFYRALYSSLYDPRLPSTSKHGMYLSLLHKAIVADPQLNRYGKRRNKQLGRR